MLWNCLLEVEDMLSRSHKNCLIVLNYCLFFCLDFITGIFYSFRFSKTYYPSSPFSFLQSCEYLTLHMSILWQQYPSKVAGVRRYRHSLNTDMPCLAVTKRGTEEADPNVGEGIMSWSDMAVKFESIYLLRKCIHAGMWWYRLRDLRINVAEKIFDCILQCFKNKYLPNVYFYKKRADVAIILLYLIPIK